MGWLRLPLLLNKSPPKQLTRVIWRKLKSDNDPAKWVKCFLVSNIVKGEIRNAINFIIVLINKELIGGLLF